MKSDYSHTAIEASAGDRDGNTKPEARDKEILRLQQETQVLELIAYSLLSVVGVFSLFALLGVDFGTSFDKAPLLLLLTCCSALTYMTRKNKLARLQDSVSSSRTAQERGGRSHP